MRRRLSAAGLVVTALALVATLCLPVAARGQHRGAANDGAPQSAPPAPPPAPAPPPPAPSAAPSSGNGGGFQSSGDGSERAVRRAGDRVDRAAQPAPTAGEGSGHRRRDNPGAGQAVPRGSVPQSGGGGVIVTPAYGGGFYPWGFAYGGAAISGYYGGYLGAYDPWYGWFPTYGPSYSPISGYDGALRLKVKPVEATVYVDGYYVGVVDNFDGIFQRLHIEAGPHRIEIRAPQYETLAFDVRITPDETTTYRGELVRQP